MWGGVALAHPPRGGFAGRSFGGERHPPPHTRALSAQVAQLLEGIQAANRRFVDARVEALLGELTLGLAAHAVLVHCSGPCAAAWAARDSALEAQRETALALRERIIQGDVAALDGASGGLGGVHVRGGGARRGVRGAAV